MDIRTQAQAVRSQENLDAAERVMKWYIESAQIESKNPALSAFEQAHTIVETLLRNLGPDRCTWSEAYPEAYRALQAFRTDMIEDVKHCLENPK